MTSELSPLDHLLKSLAEGSSYEIEKAIRRGANWLEPLTEENCKDCLGFFNNYRHQQKQKFERALEPGITPFHLLLVNPTDYRSSHGDETTWYKSLVSSVVSGIVGKKLSALPSGNSPLHSAIAAGKFLNNSLLKKIVRRMKVSDLDTYYDGVTPYLRCWTSDRMMIGCDLATMDQVNQNAKTIGRQDSALHLIVLQTLTKDWHGKEKKRIIKKMIGLGVDPNGVNVDGNTFLHCDDKHSHVDLEQLGVDLYVVNNIGHTWAEEHNLTSLIPTFESSPQLDWERMINRPSQFLETINNPNLSLYGDQKKGLNQMRIFVKSIVERQELEQSSPSVSTPSSLPRRRM